MVSPQDSDPISGKDNTTSPDGSSGKRPPSSSEDKSPSAKGQKLDDGDGASAAKETNTLTPADSGKRDTTPASAAAATTVQPSPVSKVKDRFNWYERGAKIYQAELYRKGACENCGAITHNRKACMERPRVIGAKYTNKFIAADEKIESFELDYAAKRDPWNGYDQSNYRRVVQDFEAKEDARKESEKNKKLKLLEDQLCNKKVAERSKSSPIKRTPAYGTSNPRDREDTAKYLRNLDVNSAYYDPKSRSMREDPSSDADPTENFYSVDKGVGNSQPPMKEIYGNAERLKKEILLGETDSFVEYDRAGRIIKDQEEKIPKSRYEEDIYPKNHTSVWGSWWKDHKWGYKCCQQTVKDSYCTGSEFGPTLSGT